MRVVTFQRCIQARWLEGTLESHILEGEPSANVSYVHEEDIIYWIYIQIHLNLKNHLEKGLTIVC